MLQLYKNIKSKRIELGMTQSELAQKMGYADKSMIAKIEKGVVDLPQSKIIAFADILGVTPGKLMGWNDTAPSRKSVSIPVFGRVAAGIPLEMITDIIDFEEIPEDMASLGEYFALQIHGDSMEPRMKEGDVVIVRQQEDAETGETVIVTVNGTDAACKRLKKYRDGIELISTNPSYKTMFFSAQEVTEKPVRILGKVVELRAKF